MSSPNPHYHAAANVLLIKDGKILLSRRQNKGWGDGLLCIPGGHVEPGETPKEAALRELKEELGILAQAEDLEFLCVEARLSPNKNYLSYEFTLKTNQEPVNNEPNECSELVWVDPANLGNDIIDSFKEIIKQAYIGNSKYVEFKQA